MIEKATLFAIAAHEGQFRKDNATPYITHPIGVAKIVEKYGGDENQVCAALLHDVVEDCEGYTVDKIREAFGDDIATMVEELTNTSKIDAPHLNRAERKAVDNARLFLTSKRTKLVKLADIYYNVNDLQGFKTGFAHKFLDEKTVQAQVVKDGSLTLYDKIIESIAKQRKNLDARV